jgi:hypothetical protein
LADPNAGSAQELGSHDALAGKTSKRVEEEDTMYVRVQLLSLDPSKSQQIMRFTEEQLIPKFRRLPGFRRYTAAADLANGKGLTVTEWDSLEQAQRQLAALEVGPESADVGIEIDAVFVYEVLAQAQKMSR